MKGNIHLIVSGILVFIITLFVGTVFFEKFAPDSSLQLGTIIMSTFERQPQIKPLQQFSGSILGKTTRQEIVAQVYTSKGKLTSSKLVIPQSEIYVNPQNNKYYSNLYSDKGLFFGQFELKNSNALVTAATDLPGLRDQKGFSATYYPCVHPKDNVIIMCMRLRSIDVDIDPVDEHSTRVVLGGAKTPALSVAVEKNEKGKKPNPVIIPKPKKGSGYTKDDCSSFVGSVALLEQTYAQLLNGYSAINEQIPHEDHEPIGFTPEQEANLQELQNAIAEGMKLAREACGDKAINNLIEKHILPPDKKYLD